MEHFQGIKKMMSLQLLLTADKREIKDFPKLPSTNFFYPQNVISIPTFSFFGRFLNTYMHISIKQKGHEYGKQKGNFVN